MGQGWGGDEEGEYRGRAGEEWGVSGEDARQLCIFSKNVNSTYITHRHIQYTTTYDYTMYLTHPSPHPRLIPNFQMIDSCVCLCLCSSFVSTDTRFFPPCF